MRKRTLIVISLVSVALPFFSCSRETLPGVQEEDGERTLPMVFAGGVTAFDDITKAPADFSFSNENVVYLRLTDPRYASHPLIGRATYDKTQSPARWQFTYQGSYDNLSSGKVEAYLFEKNHSKERSYLSISYKTPVYGTTEGSYNVENDTLKINATLKPVTGRVTFNKVEDTNVRVCRFSGISYFTRFDIDNFLFESSSAPFDYGNMYYGDYLYGTMSNEACPILDYYENYYYGCHFVTYPTAGFLQVGKSGYLSLPTPDSHDGWFYCSDFTKYDSYRWISFRYIGAGTFTMRGEQVTITHPYFMMEQEVTSDLWRYAMEDNEYDYDNIAITGKSFETIQLFCEKLSQKWEGYSFRLPTEAEWELAAKSGISRLYDYPYSGGSDLANCVRLWTDETYDDDNPFVYRVRQRNANGCSLFDMSGNVAELCSDWYDESMTYRVVRGGSAFDYDNLERLTVTHRCSEADYPADQIGFRIVVEVTPFMFD